MFVTRRRTYITRGCVKIMAYSSCSVSVAVATALQSLGYSELKPMQKQVVDAFVGGRDVFVSLPTGSGKSLCYSILPSVFDTLRGCNKSIMIVVSPLIALMQDQVQSLCQKDVRAAFLCGGTDSITKSSICAGDYQVLFVSPEMLLRDKEMRDILQSPTYQENVVGLAVDEAHCVKKW